ncbi:MAG: hypothetical protein DHS80DRAFT_29555 [Piptocephalis tieghemiana]|nr:MAG: hypothetical protein DHS80DRAFT_29555 [Piptocephalis tieghemiana]
MPLLALTAGTLLGGVALRRYCAGGKNEHFPDQTGRYILITGANSGIGLETAVGLAKLGATVTVACRDSEKTRNAVEEIKRRSESTLVTAMYVDLADLRSVKALADRYLESGQPLHTLINNAGLIMISTRETSAQGHEKTLAVNHLAHHYLTRRLLPLLRDSAPSRVINVSAAAPSGISVNLEDLEFEDTPYVPREAYKNTKLLNILESAQLNRMTEDLGILVVSATPGVVRDTDAGRYIFQTPRMALLRDYVLNPLGYVLAKSLEEGAQTNLYCALAPLDELEGGAYYKDCQAVVPGCAQMSSVEAQKRAWVITENMLSEWLKDVETIWP